MVVYFECAGHFISWIVGNPLSRDTLMLLSNTSVRQM